MNGLDEMFKCMVQLHHDRKIIITVPVIKYNMPKTAVLMRIGDMYHLKHVIVISDLNKAVRDALGIPAGPHCEFFIDNAGNDYVMAHRGARVAPEPLGGANKGGVTSFRSSWTTIGSRSAGFDMAYDQGETLTYNNVRAKIVPYNRAEAIRNMLKG